MNDCGGPDRILSSSYVPIA